MITPNQFQQENQAFVTLVNNQVQRVTLELRKLEAMLVAGLVAPSVLNEFRQAVDEIRKTSWKVHQAMGCNQH